MIRLLSQLFFDVYLQEVMSQTQRIISLAEIAASAIPESSEYKYKCQITLRSESAQPLMQKMLLMRMQPRWLVDLKTAGDCTIVITLQYRQGEQAQPWQEAGTVEVDTKTALNGHRSTDLKIPITTWSLAPELCLNLRLTQTQTTGSDTLTLLAGQPHGHRDRRQIDAGSEVAIALPPIIPLTPAEEVLVKDVWNKLRAWKEVKMEAFFKRLLLEEPDLEYIYGDAFDSISDYFYELFDCCVHQLQPYTQNIIGEPLMGVPPEKGDTFDTVEDYGKLFADLGLRPQHWLTASKVWMWMLPSIPYLEEYDQENLQTGTESALYKFFVSHIIHPMVKAIHDYEAVFSADMKQQMANSLAPFHQNPQQVGKDFFQRLFTAHPDLLEVFGRTNMDYLALNLYLVLDFLVADFKGGSRNDVIQDLRSYTFKTIDVNQSNTISIEELLSFMRRSQLPLSLNELNTLFREADADSSGEIDFEEFEDLLVQQLSSQMNQFSDIPSAAYPAMIDVLFELFEDLIPDFTPDLRQAWQVLLERFANVIRLPKLNEERVLKKAEQFLGTIASEQAWEPEDHTRRLQEIQAEVQATGTYTHTYEELAYGAQLAWRNASKCVGRIQWNNMVVRDCRHVSDPDAMFQELEEHLRLATNGGNVQVTMTVFRPKQPQERWGPRIWNPQMIRYAAYETPDGRVMGDGANLALTKTLIERLGWQPPQPKTAFDILPLVIEVPGQAPKMYEFQRDDILEVELEHPTNPKFKALGLRWYAIPGISNFRMDIGGVTYGCLPFNGWYMETEISRDFLEDWRYDKIGEIAEAFDLDTSSESTLWRDRAALETNVAIVHSFQKAKVTLVDHQSASQQFLTHDQREKKAGRECPGDWSWVVPAAGGSACPVWHHQMRDFYLEPAYHHAADRWAIDDGMAIEAAIETAADTGDKQDRILILYASETGTAEGLARKAARQLQQFHPAVMALDEYDPTHLAIEKLLLVVTSTFGSGEMPGNGQQFLQWLKQQSRGSLAGLSYSVLGLGSTVYEHFCAAGITVDKALAKAGANCIVPLHKGDEIKGQINTFKDWLGLISRILGENETTASTLAATAPKLQLTVLEQGTPVEATNQMVPVPVVANQELLKAVVPGSRSTRYLLLDLAGTTVQYETGDHVAVHPQNPEDLVQRLCDRIDLSLDTVFTAHYVTAAGEQLADPPPIAVPTTVRQALTEALDLSLQEPFSEVLSYLQSVSPSPQEQYRLEAWLDILRQGEEYPDSVILKKTLTDNFMTIVDLFDEFPEAVLTLEALLDLLPKQKPRLYSISSCPQLQPQKLQISVGVLQIKTDGGKTRQGLCSNYLAGLEPGDHVKISPCTSNFRPPVDPTAPMLMVGPGTGVSPLIAFLQHREFLQQQGSMLGEACLYFGCRNHDDFLYEEQLKTWRSQGVLTDLQVAFSRQTAEKIYVQTLMTQNAQSLWALLSQPNCHYYVCGDARMAESVFETLVAIAKNTGHLSHLEAVEFFERMKQEKRFFTDVWGVTLHFQKAIKEVQKDNYSKAEKWLAQSTVS